MTDSFFRTFRVLLVMVFALISLGAAVRAMNAGLACPDWPLCFGDVIPDYHPQVYFEFIHRALAGLVALLSVTLLVVVLRKGSAQPKRVRGLCFFALGLLALQVIMGGLTVLLQLHEGVVAAHLSLGTGFFAVLVWIYFSLRLELPDGALGHIPGQGRWYSSGAILAVYLQIILGGFVASHYAALACTDFPLCLGQWVPTLKGVVGLQVLHRFGAYSLALVLLCYVIYLRRSQTDPEVRKWSMILFSLLLTQIVIGIGNVLLHRPPIVTVLHLAVGTAILGTVTFLGRRLSFVYQAPQTVST
jgi:heme a synthase